MEIKDIRVGEEYVINEYNESRFETGDVVTVIEKDALGDALILVRSDDPNRIHIDSVAGRRTQFVEAFELSPKE